MRPRRWRARQSADRTAEDARQRPQPPGRGKQRAGDRRDHGPDALGLQRHGRPPTGVGRKAVDDEHGAAGRSARTRPSRRKVLGVGTLTPSGTFVGTLYLRGGGDPTFGSGTFDHIMYDAGATVQTLAANLRRAGRQAVRAGSSATSPTSTRLRGGPATDYQANLETEGSLSALAYDAGFTNLQEDAARCQPAAGRRAGVRGRAARPGDQRSARERGSRPASPQATQLLASVSSPTLAKLLLLTNSPSDNFFAETLLKDMGARVRQARDDRGRCGGRAQRDRPQIRPPPSARRRLRPVAL